MTLIQEVERVEENSIKIDKSKDNINKVLKEWNTEANSISDVPEKIEDILNRIDLKYQAKGTFSSNFTVTEKATNAGNWIIGKKQIFNIPVNLEFTPKKVILIFKKIVPEKDLLAYEAEELNDLTIYSDKHNSHDNALVYFTKKSTIINKKLDGQTENLIGKSVDAIWIESFDKNAIKFGLCIGVHSNVDTKTIIYAPIEWIAFG